MSKPIDMSFPEPTTQVVVECLAPGNGGLLTFEGIKERVHTATHWKVQASYVPPKKKKKRSPVEEYDTRRTGTLIIMDGKKEIARYGSGQWRNVWIRETDNA